MAGHGFEVWRTTGNTRQDGATGLIPAFIAEVVFVLSYFFPLLSFQPIQKVTFLHLGTCTFVTTVLQTPTSLPLAILLILQKMNSGNFSYEGRSHAICTISYRVNLLKVLYPSFGQLRLVATTRFPVLAFIAFEGKRGRQLRRMEMM